MQKFQLFLCIILAAVPLATSRIPSPTDCIIDELRPNPSNPHTFYSCTSYGPVLFQCPGELCFSVRLNKCVYILDSDEDQSSESEEEQESTTENATEISPIESSEEDSSSSEEEQSSSEETTVQTTIKIRPSTTTDSIPTSTDKETSTTKITTVTSTEQPETTTQNITTTTTKPSTTTIRTTTKPSTTTTVRTTTKPTTTTTRKTTTTTIRTTTTTRPPGAIICEPGRIYYPDPTTCSRFYQCANGIPFRFSCPAGLNFNPNINVCDWPWNYPCPL